MYQIVVDYQPPESDSKIVREGIVAYNTENLGEKPKPFSIFLKNKNGDVMGGVSAWIYSESIYIYIVWIDKKLRSKGYGTKLLKAAETEALDNGCRYSTLDTFGFQAEGFYLKNGYKHLGEIKNYLFDHPRIFLRKKL